MSPANPTESGLDSRGSFLSGSFTAPRIVFFALLLTLLAIVADQFAAPILYSSSPLWAVTASMLLVWRRGKVLCTEDDSPFVPSLPIKRVVPFFAVHGLLILFARTLSGAVQNSSGTTTAAGALLAVSKLCVLAPTVLLFPLAIWKRIARVYFPEAIAGLLVLLTFFPNRALDTNWPWYGQALGRSVYGLARVFVPALIYLRDLNPTLSGPRLDVTIIPECSGISGVELFDYLFGMVMIFDWNRLKKGRALIGYAAGLLAMLLGNTIRITALVILGNRGFTESVARFHVSAGSIFFSIVFLVYLSMTYGWMLGRKSAPAQQQPAI